MANRQRRSRQEWQTIVEVWHASGHGVAEYARVHGLCAQSRYRWRRVLSAHEPGSSPVAPLPGFARVQLIDGTGERDAGIRLRPGAGVTLELASDFDASGLRRVLAVAGAL